jgi:hypothetical protein
VAGNVTPNLSDISLCEATTGWTAVGGTLAQTDNTIFGPAQGTYNLQNYASSGMSRGADFTWSIDTNLTAVTVYAWFAFSNKTIIQNKGSTGLRIRITDVSSNWGEWDIAGKDTLPHAGWICWAVRTNVAYSRTGGTNPTLTQIRKVGWRADTVTAKGTIYFDAWRYGQGLTIEGGTSGDPAKFDDIITAEETQANRWGVVAKYEGVYFVQGVLNIGKTNQTSPTYFKDTSKVVVFKDALVGTSFYGFNVVGTDSTNKTEFYLGAKSGTSGISGCIFNAAGTAKYSLTATNAFVTACGVYGCTFLGAGTITLPDTAANKETLNCTFVSCAEVLPGTGITENCFFLSAPGDAVRITSISHNIKNCSFISNLRGVEITCAGTTGFDNMKFTANTYDVNNTSGGGITVGKSNGSNPATYTGSAVTFTGSVQLTMTVKTEGGSPINGALAYIDDNDQSPFIMNTTTNSNGIATVAYTGSPVTGARWRVRLYGYKAYYQLLDISGDNISIPVTLVVDPQQSV